MSKSVFYGPGIVNPPSHDGRCECCGRHISKLKPYGGSGDPLVGDFTGVYLLRRFRPTGPYNDEAEVALKEAWKCSGAKTFKETERWLIQKYSMKKTEEMLFAIEMNNLIGKSWECRDCAILYETEYFDKLNARDEL
jgi:hypothetical protein